MMESNAQGGLGRRLRAGFHRVVYALWDYSDQLDELRKIADREKAEKKLNDMAEQFAEKYRGGDPVWTEYLKLKGKYTLPNIPGLSAEELVVYRELDIQLFAENGTRRRDLNRARVELRWVKERDALKKMEDENAAEKKLDALIKEIGSQYDAEKEQAWTEYIRLDGELALNGRLKFEKSARRTELQIDLYGPTKNRRRHLKRTRAKVRWKKERAALKKITDKKAAEKKLDALVEELGPKYDEKKEQAWTEYIRLDGELALNELSAKKSIRRQELRIEVFCDCSNCKRELGRLRLKKRWKDEMAALKEETEPAADKLEMLIQELGPQYEGKAEAWTEYIRLDGERQLEGALPHEKAVRCQELLIELYGETKERREKLENLQRRSESLSEVLSTDEFRFSAAAKGGEKKEYVLSEGTHFLEEIGLNVEIKRENGALNVKFSGNNKEDLPIDIEFAGSNGRETNVRVKPPISKESAY